MSEEKFFFECFDHLRSKNIVALRKVFLKYFPADSNGQVYNFDELPEGLKKDVEYTMKEGIECWLPEIVDISLEFFGRLVPFTNGSWTINCTRVGAISVLKRMHELGLELDAINSVSDSQFPLLTANNPEMVAYLLSIGADPTVRDPETGQTALELAYINENLASARLLANPTTIAMPLRIDPESNDYDGYGCKENILDLARHEKNTQFIEFFERILNKV